MDREYPSRSIFSHDSLRVEADWSSRGSHGGHSSKSCTKEKTGQFIKLRGENHHLFTGAKNSATVACRTILVTMGQQGKVTPCFLFL
ncbi:hypothetical protein CHARACLAT_022891 [Characodon lateralis]|uniref:Uncharacterized protein n=1 Tax=Characodon lateralis TaxID=208331 RepID=A0ABU7F5P6_9TELE|nr:hypothetical protein [Characodon lateralis]